MSWVRAPHWVLPFFFFLFLHHFWGGGGIKQKKKNEKHYSASGNRTPAVGVRDRNPNHWTNADLFLSFTPADHQTSQPHAGHTLGLCACLDQASALVQWLGSLAFTEMAGVRIPDAELKSASSLLPLTSIHTPRKDDDLAAKKVGQKGPCRGLNPGPLPP